MNPGPVEEGGKIATALIDSLRASPGILALVVFNIISLVFIYASERAQRSTIEGTLTELLAQQRDMTNKLYNCTPTQPTSF